MLVTLAATGGTEADKNAPVIAAAGDLLGHLIGTVSRADGTIPVKDAAIEIGRASCRERVEISVVAVSLKKKKKSVV